MLDKFLVLLERFVVAHELIAANSARETLTERCGDVSVSITRPIEDLPVEGEDVIDTKPAEGRGVKAAKAEPEDDLADDEEPEEKPKRKPRQAKPKDEPKGPDVAALREEIKTIAKHIAASESDECADDFDDLLESFSVRTVTKLKDEDVEAFHKDATKLVGKYYEVEED